MTVVIVPTNVCGAGVGAGGVVVVVVVVVGALVAVLAATVVGGSSALVVEDGGGATVTLGVDWPVVVVVGRPRLAVRLLLAQAVMSTSALAPVTSHEARADNGTSRQ
jgi:hypothetical protein